jgi:hypothetical protein
LGEAHDFHIRHVRSGYQMQRETRAIAHPVQRAALEEERLHPPPRALVEEVLAHLAREHGHHLGITTR